MPWTRKAAIKDPQPIPIRDEGLPPGTLESCGGGLKPARTKNKKGRWRSMVLRRGATDVQDEDSEEASKGSHTVPSRRGQLGLSQGNTRCCLCREGGPEVALGGLVGKGPKKWPTRLQLTGQGERWMRSKMLPCRHDESLRFYSWCTGSNWRAERHGSAKLGLGLWGTLCTWYSIFLQS